MKHTPGPWDYRECKPNSGWWFIDCPNGSIGWGTFASPPDAQEDYGESNIRVMAAAPDLLNALKIMLHGEEIGEYECQRTGFPRLAERWDKARAAIAKAEGQSGS